jgi:hypothetical protein
MQWGPRVRSDKMNLRAKGCVVRDAFAVAALVETSCLIA